MHTVVSALLFLAIAPTNLGWPVAGLHVASVPVARLPPADRAIVARLLRPELGPLFQGEPPQVTDKTIQTFRAEQIHLANARSVALQGTGDLCSPTNNCSLWIVDLQHRRVLLKTIAQRYTLDRSRSPATPDIVTAMHSSATQAELTRWQFEDAHYFAATCATLDSADADGRPYNQPKFTPHSCNPEGTDSTR